MYAVVFMCAVFSYKFFEVSLIFLSVFFYSKDDGVVQTYASPLAAGIVATGAYILAIHDHFV